MGARVVGQMVRSGLLLMAQIASAYSAKMISNFGSFRSSHARSLL